MGPRRPHQPHHLSRPWWKLRLVILCTLHILYIANHSRWKSLTVFADQPATMKFSSEISHNAPVQKGLSTQDYHATANAFRLSLIISYPYSYVLYI